MVNFSEVVHIIYILYLNYYTRLNYLLNHSELVTAKQKRVNKINITSVRCPETTYSL